MLKTTYMRFDELNRLLNRAVELPTLSSLLHEKTFSNTSIDDVPLLVVRLGNKTVCRIVLDISKDAVKNVFMVGLTSLNQSENAFYYTKDLEKHSLRRLIYEILNKFLKRYCRRYRYCKRNSLQQCHYRGY